MTEFNIDFGTLRDSIKLLEDRSVRMEAIYLRTFAYATARQKAEVTRTMNWKNRAQLKKKKNHCFLPDLGQVLTFLFGEVNKISFWWYSFLSLLDIEWYLAVNSVMFWSQSFLDQSLRINNNLATALIEMGLLKHSPVSQRLRGIQQNNQTCRRENIHGTQGTITPLNTWTYWKNKPR